MKGSSAAPVESAPRILIVEDERIVAMDLAGTLTELGYSVAGMASRGEEAIEKAQQLNPHLILMDVRLAGKIDGIQAAQTIREHQDVPVVYLTAHADSDTLRRAANSEASGYLVKPFRSPELRCAIEIALHKHMVDMRLRESEQWLSTTLQSIAEAVIATDQAGRVRFFNRIAEELTGWQRAEATDHTVDEVLALVDERTGTRVENIFHKALQLREPVTITEGSTLISRTGQSVAVEESAAPIVDPYGNLLGGVLVLRDVTERRQQLQEIHKLNAELEQRVRQRTAQLEAANQELEAFSYSVAHDLRAPLRGIDGFSRLLLERYAGRLDEEGVHYLGRVCSAAERMSQLIDALLALARVGRSEVQLMEIELSRLAQTLVDDLLHANPDRKVRVTIEPGLRVRGDPRMMRIAMGNLLDNAWKFTVHQPVAEIGIGALPGSAQTYFVRDNGAGFDPAYSNKLFGAFERLHTESEFPGTGIGLAIVQRIMARHGGKIWATSQPGHGATFFFTLPPAMH